MIGYISNASFHSAQLMGDDSSRPFFGIVSATLLVLSCFSIYSGHLKPLYDPSNTRKEKERRRR